MFSIFISYNRKNQPIADALSRDLRALGHTVWLDEELSGGQRWWDEILARVRQCDVFVFILDRHSLSSAACSSECGYASALGKPILPVRVSPDVSGSNLPDTLSIIQFVDYTEKDRDAALRLARALGAIKGAPPLPDPLPKPPEVPLSYLGKLAPLVNSSSDLSRAQQADLLFELRAGLNDPETADETRDLLRQLRARPDLLARVGRDIDDLLRNPPPPPPPHVPKPHTPPPQIPNYLVWAILTTIMCCPAFGIVAIINAASVNKKIALGDYSGAMASSKNARTFAILGAITAVILLVAYLIFYVAVMVSYQQPTYSGY